MSFERILEMGDDSDPAVCAARELALARRTADALAADIMSAEDETAPVFEAASKRLSKAEAALIEAVPTTLEGALAKLFFHVDWMAESCGCLNVRGGHPLARSVENLISGLEVIARSKATSDGAFAPALEPTMAGLTPPGTRAIAGATAE